MTCVCVRAWVKRERARAVPLRKLLLILMTVTNAISNSLCTAQHTCKHDTHSTHSPTWMHVCVCNCVCVCACAWKITLVTEGVRQHRRRADQKPGEGRQSGAGKGLVQRREAIGDGEEEEEKEEEG